MNTPQSSAPSSKSPSHAELLDLWQAAWPERLPSTAGLAQRLQNPAEWLWRRDHAGKLIAFAAYRAPETHSYGYLRLLLVHPNWQRRGLGAELVAEARRSLGPIKIALGEERGHFFPGATQSSLHFWEKVGFVATGAKCVDMRCDLRELPALNLPPHLRLTDAREPDILAGVLALTDAVFSPRWTADAQNAAQSPRQVLALAEDKKVLGFALTGLVDDPLVLPSCLYPNALRRGFAENTLVGGLGPIGLHPSVRGQGLGRDFMLAAMQHLKTRGAGVMGIDWTGIAPFYEKLGFSTWATYWHMRG